MDIGCECRVKESNDYYPCFALNKSVFGFSSYFLFKKKKFTKNRGKFSFFFLCVNMILNFTIKYFYLKKISRTLILNAIDTINIEINKYYHSILIEIIVGGRFLIFKFNKFDARKLICVMREDGSDTDSISLEFDILEDACAFLAYFFFCFPIPSVFCYMYIVYTLYNYIHMYT